MKVLAVAGSSGGHIFPALALLDYLKKNYPQVDARLVLPKTNIKKDIEDSEFKLSYIDPGFFEKKISRKSFLGALKFLKGCWQSLIIILRFEPDVVVGFGSIVSIPLIMFGWLMRLKVVLHEQNVIPGQANRFLSSFCSQVAVSFSQTKEYFRNCPEKIVITGNPLRGNLTRVDKAKCGAFLGLDENKFTILAMGGSQGSLRVNQGFLKALADLPGKENVQVIHLSGPADKNKLEDEYSALGVKARVFPFLNKMEYAFSLADLAVCRAGATSIQELIHYRLPAVLLPYPFAYQHQTANAEVLQDMGAGIILEDKELDSGKLSNILESLVNHRENIEKMRLAYDSFESGSADRLLAELVMDRNTAHG